MQAYFQRKFYDKHSNLYRRYNGDADAYQRDEKHKRIREMEKLAEREEQRLINQKLDEERDLEICSIVNRRADIKETESARKEKEERTDEDPKGVDPEGDSETSEGKSGGILMAKVPIKLSSGRKRRIAAALAAIINLLAFIPGTGGLIIYVQGLAAALGIAGVSHGAVKKDLNKFKLAGLASLLSALTFLAYFVPALAPYLVELQGLAALLGAGAVGASLKK